MRMSSCGPMFSMCRVRPPPHAILPRGLRGRASAAALADRRHVLARSTLFSGELLGEGSHLVLQLLHGPTQDEQVAKEPDQAREDGDRGDDADDEPRDQPWGKGHPAMLHEGVG